MQAQVQRQELEKMLASLTPDKASVLAAQLERQRLEGKGGAQVEVVLTALRKQLGGGVWHWPKPQRLFCVAFEEFLIDARRDKHFGRILRSSVDPVWAWLLDKALPGRGGELDKQIARATLDRNEPLKAKLVAALQAEASAAMSAALDAAPRRSKAAEALADILGGEDVLEDMREMAILLAKPTALVPFCTLVPHGLNELSEDTISNFRHLYETCIADAPELGAYSVILAMNRLARPWEAMALVRAVSRQSQDRLLTETDMGFAGELLIADIEDLAADAASVRPEKFDAAQLSMSLERLSAASAGMARELGIRRDGKWGARIQKARTAAANAAHALLGRAAQEVLSAFPTQRNGSFAKGPRKPDLTHSPDPARVSRAIRWATLMAAIKPTSAGLGFQSALQAAHDEVEGTLRQYTDGVLAEMRAGGAETRATANAYLDVQANVAAALFGDEAAALLRRRAAAAMAA